MGLEPLAPPLLLMVGNHDRRSAFREASPEAVDDSAGCVQSLRVIYQLSLITLHTRDEDGSTGIVHAGYLSETRLQFLERALADAPTDRPLILAQHHPAARLGLSTQDTIGLQNCEAEVGAIEHAGRRPDLLLHGHVHRPVFGLRHGIPFHIHRAFCHEKAYHTGPEPGIPDAHESPDLTVLRMIDSALVPHGRACFYDGPRFNMGEAVAGRSGP
ncbi:MAG: metallophosphoesterase [Pseudomonadota bacterium]